MALEFFPLRDRGMSDSITKIRIALMGAKNVGKTAIAQRYTQKRFKDGSCHEQRYQKRAGGYVLEILDISTDASNPNIPNGSSLPACDAFILVFSVDDMASFDYITDLREVIISARGETIPIVVAGNKSELSIREVHYALADCVVSIDWEIPYFEISAKTNHNIVQLFKRMMDHPQFRTKAEGFIEERNTFTSNCRRTSSLPASSSISKIRHFLKRDESNPEESTELNATQNTNKSSMKSKLMRLFHKKAAPKDRNVEFEDLARH